MKIQIQLSSITFLFILEREVSVSEVLSSFIVSLEKNADIIVNVSWDWNSVKLPDTEPLGEDLICRYYVDQTNHYCAVRGGSKGYVACTIYDMELKNIQCIFNEKPFLNNFRSLDMVLRMLPMREILQHFGTLFFHASQIGYKGKGILFTAPSGIGKSTQAKLWRQYREAEIICGDRTLARKTKDVWYNYGYPIDGSEPVRSDKIVRLVCIVLLEQGKDNRIRQLPPSIAIPRLMQQLVIDVWNPDARIRAIELLFKLVEDIPVLHFSCTPDENAVNILEGELIRKGIF